eukprot:292574-Hanusia_phi.AAC.1
MDVHAELDEVKPVVEKLQQVIKVEVKPNQDDKVVNQRADTTADRAKRKPLMDNIPSPLVPNASGQCMPGFHSKVTEGSAAEPARKMCWPNSLKAAENGMERMVLDAEEQAFMASSEAIRRAQSAIRLQQTADRYEDAEERRAAAAAVMKVDKGNGVADQPKSKALMERDRILKASRAAEEQARRKFEEVQKKVAQKKIEKEREFQQLEDAELRRRMKAEQAKEEEAKKKESEEMQQQERERALQKAQEEEIKRAIEVGIDPTTDTMPLKPKKKD